MTGYRECGLCTVEFHVAVRKGEIMFAEVDGMYILMLSEIHQKGMWMLSHMQSLDQKQQQKTQQQ